MVRSSSGLKNGSLQCWVVVDDITNQLKPPQPPHSVKPEAAIPPHPSSRVVVAATKRKLPPVKGRGKKRGRYKTKAIEEPVPQSCKYCDENFPEQYLCLEHEDICRKMAPPGHTDLRDAPDRLLTFAAFLGLVPTATVNTILEKENLSTLPQPEPVELVEPEDPPPPPQRPKDFVFKRPKAPPVRVLRRTATSPPPPPVRNLRKVPSRSKIGAYLKKHPILPISSIRGQKVLEEFGERITPSTRLLTTPGYERDCSSNVVKAPPCDPPISTMKKHKIKDNQYLHHYSFSKRQKRERNTELVLGISSKSFKALNRCKPLVLTIDELPERIVQEIQTRDAERHRKFAEFIATIENDPYPVVRVRDVLKDPNALTKEERKKFKINFKSLPKGTNIVDLLGIRNTMPHIPLIDIAKNMGSIRIPEGKNLKINMQLPRA